MKNANYSIDHYGYLKRLFLKLTKPSWSIETSRFVPSDQLYFLNNKAVNLSVLFKYFRRLFFFKLKGNDKYLLSQIPKSAKRLLWINLSAPSIGDVLMDLSGRVLLKGYDLDVLIQSKASELLVDDEYFKNIYKTAEKARLSHLQHPYDLIIVDSFSPWILKVKNVIAPKTPFVGMWGFLNGYEVHRTIYSFERLKKLISLDSRKYKVSLKPSLGLICRSEKTTSRNGVCKIGFAIGGEWASRTYDKWDQVIKSLDGIPCEIFLLGSENGALEADLIAAHNPLFYNFVGKRTLKETAQIISGLDLFVAADGGLWHVACALNKPSVSLFSGVLLFGADGMRLLKRDTKDINCIGLYDEFAVSNISPGLIVEAIKKQMRKIRIVTEAKHGSVK